MGRAVALAVVAAVAAVVPIGSFAAEPDASRWVPPPGSAWQIQLSGVADLDVPADIIELDGFETPRRTVAAIHAAGDRAVCYVDAGSWERWRPDAGRFPRSLLGRPLDGWPGERWLDIRRLDLLLPLIEDRVARCTDRGFDAIDFDNVDGYTNRTGFPLTAADQLRFNRSLARLAHRAGLAVGLKNDQRQAAALEPVFDFAVVEQCVEFAECWASSPFLVAGKGVVDIEYQVPLALACPRAQRLGIDLIGKSRDLGAPVERCPG